MSDEATQWATFSLGAEQFAIRVEDVQEVLLAQPLTPVPLAPPQIVGLLNLRGAVMPAIDLRIRLAIAPEKGLQNQKLLVLKTAEGLVSVIVDEIGDVCELKPEGWQAPPETLPAARRALVFGIYPMASGLLLGLSAATLCSDEADRPG